MEVTQVMAYHIRNLREASGISQRDLAIRLNLDEKNYGKLERGEKKRVDLEGVQAISKALGIGLGHVLKPLIGAPTSVSSNPETSGTDDPPPHYAYEEVIGQLLSIMRKQQFVISELDWLRRQLPTQA